MNSDDLPLLSVGELAPLIKRKEVSPVELVRAYLDRIMKVDDKLHSYITVCSDEALAAAARAEKEISQGEYRGSLHGIPVSVKDQFLTKGVRTTRGSRAYANLVPEEDATVVARLKQAGSVLLGKLNMSEFAMGGTRSHPYGDPRNPWDLERSPGVSSSGSGAAMAASLAAATLGEDTGGSARIPATHCGVVGLRPTLGRVSRFGIFPMCWSMDTAGPITRTARDCALMLQVIAGHDPKDPLSRRLPVPDYLRGLDVGIKGMRVGYVKELFDSRNNHEEIQRAAEQALTVFGELGAFVEEVSIPLTTMAATIAVTIYEADGANVHEELVKTRAQELDSTTRARIFTGSLVPAKFYQRAMKARQLLRSQMVKVMKRVEVLLLPGAANPPPRIVDEARTYESKADVIQRMFGVRSYTAPHSLAGMPVISIPCGFTSFNLPIGLQIGGRYFEESTVLMVAQAFQANTDWHLKKPNI